jgi:hypothetical protein
MLSPAFGQGNDIEKGWCVVSKVLEYIKKDKSYYGEILFNLNNAVTEIGPYVDWDNLNSRKYVTRLPVLKRYLELLGDIENKEMKDGFLGFMNDEKHINQLENYKRQNLDALTQLEKCNQCVRHKCPPSCKVSSCLSCRPGSRVVHCDHKKMKVVFHDDWTLDLTNDKTGRNERYKVLATLEDAEKDQEYIVIEGFANKDKFVLYYNPGISEDSYGEISNEQEFDFVVSTFEGIER